MLVLPTSNSWWVFDEPHSRYRRIPRDMDPEEVVPNGDWQSYSELEIDPDNSGFTVFLNEEKTSIMRAYIEAEDLLGAYDNVSVATNT